MTKTGVNLWKSFKTCYIHVTGKLTCDDTTDSGGKYKPSYCQQVCLKIC
jgi:hypothetical protein